MKAPDIKIIRHLSLIAVCIILLQSQACSQKGQIPSPQSGVGTESNYAQLETQIHPSATNTSQPTRLSTATSLPAATIASPTPTPFDPNLPVNALARFNLGGVERFALSHQHDLLAAANSGFVCLYTTEGYERAWCKPSLASIDMEDLNISDLGQPIHLLEFRPDGKQIAMALWSGDIVILDTSTGNQASIIQTKRDIGNLAWSPDGKQISIQSRHLTMSIPKGGIEVWEAATGKFVRQLEIEPETLGIAEWSDDGSILATTEIGGKSITLWDANKDVPLGIIEIQAEGYVSSMAFSPGNKKLYAGISTNFPCEDNCDLNNPGGYKGWIASWWLDDGSLVEKLFAGDAITRLAISPDGERVAAGGGIMGSFLVLDMNFGGRVNVKLSDTHADDGLDWLDNDRVLYLPEPNHVDAESISQWDMAWNAPSEILLPGYETFYSMAWLPDGEHLITNSAGGTISIWKANIGERLEQSQLMIGGLPVIKFNPTWISPIEPWLAVGAEGSLAIVDLETRQVLQWLDHADMAPEIYVVDVAWSMDGQRIAALLGDSAHSRLIPPAVWDVQTGERLLTVSNEDFSYCCSISLSPDGKQLAVSQTVEYTESNHKLVVIDIASGRQVSSLDIETTTLHINWFSQNKIAFSSFPNTSIWNLALQNQHEIPGSSSYSVISPNEILAAGPCSLVGISIWDIRTGKEYTCLQALYDQFGSNSLAFNSKGNLLASLTDYGSVIVWDMSEFISK